MKATLAVSMLAGLALANPVPADDSFDLEERAACPSGKNVHIITVRGTNQTKQDSTLNPFISQLVPKLGNGKSTVLELAYPASTSPTYPDSETTGANNLNHVLQQYTKSCPNTKVVLVGYSQGAQVITDVLCGQDELYYGAGDFHYQGTGVSGGIVKQIQSVVLFADPTRVAGTSWNVGTADSNSNTGLFPRGNAGACSNTFAHKVAAYCTSGDTVCDGNEAGSGDPSIHPQEVQLHTKAATHFIVSKN